jgi:hypothetical protein
MAKERNAKRSQAFSEYLANGEGFDNFIPNSQALAGNMPDIERC